MTQQYVPNLGEVPDEDARRDAVHIVVAPVVADCLLFSGQKVKLTQDGKATICREGDEAVGVVDPFFKNGIVSYNRRFWLFLYPNTVTSLRHVWSHPAFKAKIPESLA